MRSKLMTVVALAISVIACSSEESVNGESSANESSKLPTLADSAVTLPRDGETGSTTCTSNCAPYRVLDALQPTGYAVNTLKSGELAFLGADERVILLPSYLNGADYIKTDFVDDENNKSNALIFSVNDSANVYLLVSVNAKANPAWLRDWSRLQETVSSNLRTYNVYKKVVAEGNILAVGSWPFSGEEKINYMLAATLTDDGIPPEPPVSPADPIVSDPVVSEPIVEQPQPDPTTTPDPLPVDVPPAQPEPSAPDTVVDTPEPVPSPIVDVPANTEWQLDIEAPSKYRWTNLALGANVYIDRSYRYASIPDEYSSFTALMTANSDKLVSSDSYLKFSSNKAVEVYVAMDERQNVLPSWLSNWQATGETVSTTDANLTVYKRGFAPGKVVLGGNHGTLTGSNYVVFVAEYESISENKPDDVKPIALNDFATVEAGGDAEIRVLANDTGLEDQPVILSIINQPKHGKIDVNQSEITYHADEGYDGADSFDYQLVDEDGDRTVATVVIEVNCDSCLEKKISNIQLSWTPSRGKPSVYEIYAASSDLQLLDSLKPIRVVGASQHSYNLDTNALLDLNIVSKTCFRLRARNAAGASEFSDAACVDL